MQKVRKGYTEGCAIAKAEYPDCNKRFIIENQPNGPKVHWAGFIIVLAGKHLQAIIGSYDVRLRRSRR
jgi:hypothetical protein